MLLAICMITFLTVTVSAAEARYSENNSVTLNLSFTSRGAEYYCKIRGGVGTTSITDCSITLTDSVGNIILSQSNLSATGSTFISSGTVSNIVPNETYTLSVTANVNKNGSVEPVSDSISQTNN